MKEFCCCCCWTANRLSRVNRFKQFIIFGGWRELIVLICNVLLFSVWNICIAAMVSRMRFLWLFQQFGHHNFHYNISLWISTFASQPEKNSFWSNSFQTKSYKMHIAFPRNRLVFPLIEEPSSFDTNKSQWAMGYAVQFGIEIEINNVHIHTHIRTMQITLSGSASANGNEEGKKRSLVCLPFIFIHICCGI